MDLTKIIDTQVKVSAWYDNEWGFSNRLVELSEYVAGRLDGLSVSGGPLTSAVRTRAEVERPLARARSIQC
jgi:hypothetical protein